MEDLPMLQVVAAAAETCFVPLTVGGGIRGYQVELPSDHGDSTPSIVTKEYTALEVASGYFRAGADKVSIGSDAVYSVEDYLATGLKTGLSSIEQISK
jgi:imidazole glycerol-phosphate synthase